jgi:hypothetical protein
VLGALGKDQFALGKGFAKCHTLQSALDKKFVAKGFCRVSFIKHSAKILSSAGLTLGKEKSL